ncbi:MAG: trypsin-like peptidase domain-containing protein [Elusimicrobia bacterium]|nr:trypsin-like peptidase domain-containing protein [Elusimicrobiota bacterium]
MLPLLPALLLAALSVCPRPAGAAIFGPDARQEIHQDERAARLAPSTAIMISDVFIKKKPGGRFDIEVGTIHDSPLYHLCKNERFWDQPSAAVNCTGFLVGPDLLATAGHCMIYPSQEINEASDTSTPFCSTFAWLFDYGVKPDGTVDMKDVPEDRLVRCKRVIQTVVRARKDPATGVFAFGPDAALIQLERPVPRRALKPSKSPVKVGDEVSKIGHPSGLPAKWTGRASVIAAETDYYRTTLDGHSGDSGGPVFNDADEVIGILVRTFPEGDYLHSNSENCARPNRCDASLERCAGGPSAYPLGAQIQRIQPILDWLDPKPLTH